MYRAVKCTNITERLKVTYTSVVCVTVTKYTLTFWAFVFLSCYLMRPSLTCSTAQHTNNSVTIICIKPVQQALVQYKALRPISGLDQCIDSLCTHKSREAESGSNGPHSHAVTWASCRTARGPVARASAHTPSRHNQPVISWPRDVFEAVPPELTKRWDLCEKRLEWVPEENSWGRGMLCTRY